jgi:hypothetical protein
MLDAFFCFFVFVVTLYDLTVFLDRLYDNAVILYQSKGTQNNRQTLRRQHVPLHLRGSIVSSFLAVAFLFRSSQRGHLTTFHHAAVPVFSFLMGCESSKQNLIEIEDAQFRDLEVRMSEDKGRKITLRSAAMAVRVASVRNPLVNRGASKDAKRASLLGNGGPQAHGASSSLTTTTSTDCGGAFEHTKLQPFHSQQKTTSNVSARSTGTYASGGGVTTADHSTKSSPNPIQSSSMYSAHNISAVQKSIAPVDMDVQSIGDDDDMDS